VERPTGEKFALLIGIEYVDYTNAGKMTRLPGCHADIEAMIKLLKDHYQVESQNITVLSDQPQYASPTADGILRAMTELVDRVKLCDRSTVYFYYSGHGTQEPDQNKDEADKKDECIVPCDFLTAGVITDDVIHKTLFRELPGSVRCFAIADCCNSDTLFDLGTDSGNHSAQIVTLSGCKDDQTSASAFEQKTGWRGALTVALEETLHQYKYRASQQNVLEGCRKKLASKGHKQLPQLCVNRVGACNNVFL